MHIVRKILSYSRPYHIYRMFYQLRVADIHITLTGLSIQPRILRGLKSSAIEKDDDLELHKFDGMLPGADIWPTNSSILAFVSRGR